MTLAHLIAFNLALAAALVSPGPALLYAIRTALSAGRAAGIATGLGLGTMAALWTLAALLGLEGLFRAFPWAYAAMKAAGALYLIWIAVQTWRSARDPVAETARPRRRAFLGGALVNLANPKSVVFAAAVLVVIFPPGLAVADKALIVLNHLAVEAAFYSVLAVSMTTPAVSRRYLALKPAFDRIAAVILGALGARLLVDR